jgi:hypothetical protein
MHISITIRAYKSEKDLVDLVKKRLGWYVREDIPEMLLEEIGYENVEEDEELVDYRLDVHLYPNAEIGGEELRYYIR